MNKPNYLMNGFIHLMWAFQKHIPEYDYTFLFPKSRPGLDYLTNYALYKKWQRQGKINKFSVVHINNWENVLNYRKLKGQIGIIHAHGFYVGLDFDRTIREVPFFKRESSKVLQLLLDKKMKQKFKESDLFYVATPNMLAAAQQIREDAKWLPNPIDTSHFNPKGEKVDLEGDPAVFLPSRLHVFKNPIFALNIFQKIKQQYPSARLHLVHYGNGMDPLYPELRKQFHDPSTYIWHTMLPRDVLHKYYRSADLVLGQFNPNLGNLSLVELEAMACGAPIVTLDNYETNTPLDRVEYLAFRILKSSAFKKQYVTKNLRHVLSIHSEQGVAKLHHRNLKHCSV